MLHLIQIGILIEWIKWSYAHDFWVMRVIKLSVTVETLISFLFFSYMYLVGHEVNSVDILHDFYSIYVLLFTYFAPKLHIGYCFFGWFSVSIMSQF